MYVFKDSFKELVLLIFLKLGFKSEVFGGALRFECEIKDN